MKTFRCDPVPFFVIVAGADRFDVHLWRGFVLISFDMLEHCAEALILGDGRKCDPAIWVYNCMGQDDAVGAHLNPIERL